MIIWAKSGDECYQKGKKENKGGTGPRNTKRQGRASRGGNSWPNTRYSNVSGTLHCCFGASHGLAGVYGEEHFHGVDFS